MMRRKPKINVGEKVIGNAEWEAYLISPNVVRLRNVQTNDVLTMPLHHLYSLAAIAEEVRRILEAD